MGIAEQQEALRRRRFTVEEYHKMARLASWARMTGWSS
jgi:hypothetical protein